MKTLGLTLISVARQTKAKAARESREALRCVAINFHQEYIKVVYEGSM